VKTIFALSFPQSSYLTREFNSDDSVMQLRFEMSFREESPITDFRDH
jgi:hypothetical protein